MIALKTPLGQRFKRWIPVATLLVVLVGIAIPLAISFLPNPAIARARNRSIQLLAEAADAPAMEQAVGSLGIIFHLANGSWIAIRYVDTHYGGIWSSSVALDSQGDWFESDVHFCGQFKIYRDRWDHTLEVLQNPRTPKDEKNWWLENCPVEAAPAPIWHLEASPGLKSAREKLLALGFKQLNIQTVPKMSGAWPEKVEAKASILQD
jgi:hypothetical protein